MTHSPIGQVAVDHIEMAERVWGNAEMDKSSKTGVCRSFEG